MKVLHYIPSIDESSGVVGAYMQLIARDLGNLCELHVITHKGNNERVLENCVVHYIPYKWKPWDNCKIIFLEILNEISPDVFHTNCCWMPLSALTAMWAKKAGFKVIYSPHGMLEPYAIKRHYWTKKFPAILLFQKKGISVSDLIHATAEQEKENLLRLGWNRKISVVSNCVQIDEIQIKESWKSTKKILFLSRIHPKKGLNFLIEAVGEIRERFKGYSFIIAGEGDKGYVKELQNMALRNGVSEMFEFIGPVYGTDKWALYRHADLFVLPSWSENFGIVVAEALACGTPVITTVGTPWLELNSSHCGWCINIGTRALVKAFLQFLDCSEYELKQMGINGRELVCQKYSSKTIAGQFADMYKGVSSRH